MRADRLVSIILLLQARGRLTAEQLSAELEVSVRTIYRDVVALGAAGVPIYGEHGIYGGYRLLDGYRTQLTGLTGDEAAALFLAGLPGPAAELGMAEAVAAARLKLTAALSEPLRERAERMRQRFHLDSPGWFHDGDRADCLTEVARAVWEQRVIQIRYQSWKSVVSRRLEPYGLVLKAGKWYLVAKSDRGWGTYRVNHVDRLEVLDERFERPDDFDLVVQWRAEVERFRAGLPQYVTEFRLYPAVRERLAHHLGRAVADAAAAGVVEADGWIRATVPIESLDHAETEFGKLGAQVEVISPIALRERLAMTAFRLATMYGDIDAQARGSAKHSVSH